ncbi:MAG TPA: nitroreductase family protein [Armatimonadota bacterium]|nr:nitroreductase family protein [Armatimonadota bacterium]
MDTLGENRGQDTYNLLIGIIKSRRSCRKFTDTPVDAATLKKLVEAAIWAPTGCNQQEVRFVVTTKKEDLEALLKAKKVVNPQAAILIYTDTNATYYKGWWDDPHKARLQYFDAAAAAMNILLVAESLGLGALWVNVSPYWQGAHGENVVELYKRFDVPNTLKLQSAVFLGYPASEVDLSAAKWHGKPVMRGAAEDHIVNVPRKTAILHYQSPTHDNMGSRALSEGLLNLVRERLGHTHWIRLFNESPISSLLNRAYLGDDPAMAIRRFDDLAESMIRRLRYAYEIPEDSFGRYWWRSRLHASRFYGLLCKIGRRLPVSPKNLHDIYSIRREIGELRRPAWDERREKTFLEAPNLIIEPERRVIERVLCRLLPSIWGMRHIEKRLFELARFDTVIYNGDGYLADYYGDALVRRLFELHVAVRLEKEVVACNMSVDVKDDVLRALVSHVFRPIGTIVVREPLSRDELVKCGVDADKIEVGADAAIFASVEECEEIADVFGDTPVDPAKSIALILRGDRGHDASSWAQVVGELRSRLNLGVVLLSSSLKQDSLLMAQIVRESGAPAMKRATSHPRFIDLLSRFRLVISDRYHPCVFCIRTQTPVVPLTGNTLKTEGLFSLFPYSQSVLSPDASDPGNREAVVRAAVNALCNEAGLREQLREAYEILRAKASKNVSPTLCSESDSLFLRQEHS